MPRPKHGPNGVGYPSPLNQNMNMTLFMTTMVL